MQDHLAGVVGEIYVVKLHFSADAAQRLGAAGIFLFHLFAQHFAGAFEAGQGFGDLRADADDLKDRRDQQPEEKGEGEKGAGGHGAGENLPRAEIHDQGADDAHQAGGREAHDRGRGEGLQHVFEQTLRAGGENFFLALFGVIALDHANAAQRFGEPAGDFGIDFRTFAKNRADGLERADSARCRKSGYAGGDARSSAR